MAGIRDNSNQDEGQETTPSPSYFRVTQAADAYVTDQGIEHSGGIVERAFEAGARWAIDQSVDVVENYHGGGRSYLMRKIAALVPPPRERPSK